MITTSPSDKAADKMFEEHLGEQMEVHRVLRIAIEAKNRTPNEWPKCAGPSPEWWDQFMQKLENGLDQEVEG